MRERIKEAASEVHEELGPGFTESVYHSALQRELSARGITHYSEGTIPVMYKGAPVGRRRPDLFVQSRYGLVVVELKAGSSSGEEQLLQYLDMSISNDDLDDVIGGAVVRFNDELEYEYQGVGTDGVLD